MMTIKVVLALLLWCVASPVSSQSVKSLPFKAADVSTYEQLVQGFTQAFNQNEAPLLTPFYQSKPCDGCQRYDSKSDIGWGQLLVYSNKAKLLLQVPHRYHDRWTWQIAQKWAKHDKLAALMVNTVHRYAEQAHSSDFSTAPNNAFLAAAQAFIATHPEGVVVQLHGFSGQKRNTAAGEMADVVLSYGHQAPEGELGRLHKMADCIKQRLGIRAKVYPTEVTELGGTQNVIAKAFRAQGLDHQFIHLELGAELRALLKQNKTKAEHLFGCISGEWQ